MRLFLCVSAKTLHELMHRAGMPPDFSSRLRYLSSALLKSAAAARTSVGGGGGGGGVGGAFAKDQAEIEVESGEAEGTGGIVVPVSDAVLCRPVASGIRRLLLTGNDRLGDAGARALASALKKDRSLELLDLTRCSTSCGSCTNVCTFGPRRFLLGAVSACSSLLTISYVVHRSCSGCTIATTPSFMFCRK